MTTTYLDLRIGARARLAALRGYVVQHNVRRPPFTTIDGRRARFATLRTSSGIAQCVNSNEPVWVSHDGAQFRDERDADEIVNLRHTGWYTDGENCEERAIGIVARLPHGRFIAGYRLTMNDERVYFPTIFDDDDEAARMADEHARIIGELESEHADAERARMREQDELSVRIADLESDIQHGREQHSMLILAANSSGYEATYRKRRAQADDVRDNVCQWVSDLRDARTAFAQLEE